MAQDNKLIRSLIENARNGNNNAFEQLFQMHVGYVYAISFRLLANYEDANEITIKIFKEALKTISMVRRDSPFILWLKAIAIYSSLQKIRENDKDKSQGDKQTPSHKGLSFIDQELISLNESERIIFVLNDIEHYKKEEISDLLSITKEEIENLLVKAREIIMKKLVIHTPEALERAVQQMQESIEPHENLYNRFIGNISITNSQDNNKESESEQNTDNERRDIISKEEKKHFTFKDLFKKKE